MPQKWQHAKCWLLPYLACVFGCTCPLIRACLVIKRLNEIKREINLSSLNHLQSHLTKAGTTSSITVWHYQLTSPLSLSLEHPSATNRVQLKRLAGLTMEELRLRDVFSLPVCRRTDCDIILLVLLFGRALVCSVQLTNQATTATKCHVNLPQIPARSQQLGWRMHQLLWSWAWAAVWWPRTYLRIETQRNETTTTQSKCRLGSCRRAPALSRSPCVGNEIYISSGICYGVAVTHDPAV